MFVPKQSLNLHSKYRGKSKIPFFGNLIIERASETVILLKTTQSHYQTKLSVDELFVIYFKIFGTTSYLEKRSKRPELFLDFIFRFSAIEKGL